MDAGDEEDDACGGERPDGGGGSKQGMSGGMELIEAFVVWRVVVDVLLDLL